MLQLGEEYVLGNVKQRALGTDCRVPGSKHKSAVLSQNNNMMSQMDSYGFSLTLMKGLFDNKK